MATISYKTCDRCGKEIDYHSRRLVKVRKAKLIFNVCGMLIEKEYEFCKGCTEQLDKFLKPVTDNDEMPAPGRTR